MSDGEPAEASASRPAPRQRKRLRGWLIAAGLTDAAAAGRLASRLLSGEDAPGVAGSIDRLGAWLDAASGPAPAPGARPAALRALAQSEDPAAELLRAAEGGAGASPPAEERVPLLPTTLPREMNRQPLGRLPAVLRGGAWILSTRWALPNRAGPRIARSLWSWRSPTPATAPPTPGDETP